MSKKHIDLYRKVGIYKITCISNNRIYIGSAVYIKSRWAVHKKHLRDNTHVSKPMQNSWNKYGEDSFLFEVMEECEKSVLLQREQYYLDNLKPQFNYLKVAGSNLGYVPTEETREKLRKHFKGISPSNKGVPRSEETKQRLKDAWKRKKENGYKATDETRRKISEGLKGKPKSEEHVKKLTGIKRSQEAIEKTASKTRGQKRTDEQRKKMSDANKGKFDGEKNPMYGKSGELSPNFGKICKESTRKLISERAKERWKLKKQQAI